MNVIWQQFTVRQWIIILILLSYGTEILFTAIEFDDSAVSKMHPLYEGHTFKSGRHWDGEVSPVNFYYGFFEIASRALLVLAAYWAGRFGIWSNLFITCLWIEMIDMPDYWLFRNDPWYRPWFVELEFNHIKLIVLFIHSRFEWKL